MENIPFLHVYSPWVHHSTAHIIGNKPALEKLRDLIDKTLNSQTEKDAFFGYDGEEYDVKVISFNNVDKFPIVACPYMDESAKEKRDNVLWPKDLGEIIQSRKI